MPPGTFLAPVGLLSAGVIYSVTDNYFFFVSNYIIVMKFPFFLFFLFTLFPVSAIANLNPYENECLEFVTDFRWKLASCEKSSSEIYMECENLKAQYQNDFNEEKISNEVLLCIENILTWESFNYLYNEDNENCGNLKEMITSQYEKIRAYFKKTGNNGHSKWLYVTAGDILSSSLQYLSIKKAMQEGLTIKKYYDRALEEEPGFVFCLINIGQWYFHAPVVSGGGKGKAMDAFKKAETSAQTDVEKYYAKLYLSQSFYEDGKKARAAELLDECEQLLPGSSSVKLFKKLNENGYHYFEYPENRRKIDSKLAKKAM